MVPRRVVLYELIAGNVCDDDDDDDDDNDAFDNYENTMRWW